MDDAHEPDADERDEFDEFDPDEFDPDEFDEFDKFDKDEFDERKDALPLHQRLGYDLGRQQARATFSPGAKVAPVMLDRYEVRRRVGAGARGVVFEGFDPDLGRRVALKVCQLEYDGAAREIENEARALAKLSHPNIVAVHDIVRVGADVVLVMEFIEGQTLRDWQKATLPSGRDVLDRFVDAGRAIAAVHDVGLQHGDFKPQNVMLDHTGRVRVVDFGLARYSLVTSDASGSPAQSNPGTLPYMAPERLLARPSGPPADIFAFCVSVWESLYQKRPFEGSTPLALLEAIVAGKPAVGSLAESVPDGVRVVLEFGLRASAHERPQSMDELLEALAQVCERASGRRARWWRWLGGGSAAVLLVASGSMALMLSRAPDQAVVVVSEPRPEPSAVEQNLALAVKAADAGHLDSAITYLELARKWAQADGDEISLREVAVQGEALGDEFKLRGEKVYAQSCWTIAIDVFVALPYPTDSVERLKLKLRASQNR